MMSVNDVQYKYELWYRLPCCRGGKKREKHPQKKVALFTVDRSTSGHGAKNETSSETGKGGCRICLPQSVLSQLSVLKFCSVFMLSFARLDASQSDNWQSVLQSAYVLSHITRDPGYSKVCAKWVPQSLTVHIKPREKQFLSNFWHNLKPRERLLKQIKPWSIILNRRQKGHQCNGTIPNLPGRRNSQSGGKVMIILFWGCEGVILVDASGETIKSNARTGRWKSSGSDSNKFGHKRISCFTLTMLDMFEDPRSHNRICFDSVSLIDPTART